MWICLSDAFVSIVAIPKEPDYLMVRARRHNHLRRLFPDGHIITTPEPADYRYRVIVDREEVTKLLTERVEKINYTNFKDSVEDDDLHDLYLEMWFDHSKFQGKRRR
jgi:hypothetical protein